MILRILGHFVHPKCARDRTLPNRLPPGDARHFDRPGFAGRTTTTADSLALVDSIHVRRPVGGWPQLWMMVQGIVPESLNIGPVVHDHSADPDA
jgi:hypothetical protein